MKVFLFGVVLVIATGCSSTSPDAMLDTTGCLPYNSKIASNYVFDPVIGATPIATTSPPLPLPTCTPHGGTPFATTTPRPLTGQDRNPNRSVIGQVTSRPHNLTVSPWSEDLDRVAASTDGNLFAITWHGNQSFLTRITPTGTETKSINIILGNGEQAGVAISSAGRLHLYAGGSYAYSDDAGITWSNPVSAPNGDFPHIVVDHLGFPHLFWISGGSLNTTHQSWDGSWEGTINLGPTGDYDAVAVEDSIVVILSGNSSRIVQIPGGTRAILPGAAYVSLIHRLGETVAGLGDEHTATIARSLDGGVSWSAPCLVQESIYRIKNVAGFATKSGPYAVFYAWRGENFPIISLSTVYWHSGQPCYPTPAIGQPDFLVVVRWQNGPPGLFMMRAPQTEFRLHANGERAAIGFTAVTDDKIPDVWWSEVFPDNVFSGVSLGGAHAGEEGVENP